MRADRLAVGRQALLAPCPDRDGRDRDRHGVSDRRPVRRCRASLALRVARHPTAAPADSGSGDAPPAETLRLEPELDPGPRQRRRRQWFRWLGRREPLVVSALQWRDWSCTVRVVLADGAGPSSSPAPATAARAERVVRALMDDVARSASRFRPRQRPLPGQRRCRTAGPGPPRSPSTSSRSRLTRRARPAAPARRWSAASSPRQGTTPTSRPSGHSALRPGHRHERAASWTRRAVGPGPGPGRRAAGRCAGPRRDRQGVDRRRGGHPARGGPRPAGSGRARRRRRRSREGTGLAGPRERARRWSR